MAGAVTWATLLRQQCCSSRGNKLLSREPKINGKRSKPTCGDGSLSKKFPLTVNPSTEGGALGEGGIVIQEPHWRKKEQNAHV